jgi:hypothetical protein
MAEAMNTPARRERLKIVRGALRAGWGGFVRPLARGLWRGAVIGILAGIAAGELLCALFGLLGWLPEDFFCPPALWYGLWGIAGGLPTGLLLGAREGLIGAGEQSLLPVFEPLADRIGAMAGRKEDEPADPAAVDKAPSPTRLTGGWRGWILDLLIGSAAGRAMGALEAAARERDPDRRREALREASRETGACLGDTLVFVFLIPAGLVLLLVLAMLLLPPALVWLF